jgi:hypothetical protein
MYRIRDVESSDRIFGLISDIIKVYDLIVRCLPDRQNPVYNTRYARLSPPHNFCSRENETDAKYRVGSIRDAR